MCSERSEKYRKDDKKTMNEVFEKVKQRVSEYLTDYNQRMDAERAKLAEFEKALPKAEAAADAAVKANDMKAWKAADKARMDAAAGIKFEKARIAALEPESALPVEEYNDLLSQIEAEYARAELQYIGEMQNAFRGFMEKYEELAALDAEKQSAFSDLYRVAGEREDGYRIIQRTEINWPVLIKNGRAFDDILDFDIHTGAGIKPNNPVHREVMGALQAIRKAEHE